MKKMVIIIAVVVLTAASAGAAVMFRHKGHQGDTQEGAQVKEEARLIESEGSESGEGPNVSLSFIVNLGDDLSDMHYLKVTVAVELSGPAAEKTFEGRQPKVRNNVLMYLSSVKPEEMQGTDNKKKMVEHLRDEIRESGGKSVVKNVYLTEFVIQ